MYNSLKILLNALKRERLKSNKDTLNIYTIALNLIIDPNAIKLIKELNGLFLALTTIKVYLD
jgi:hypothetical protein